MSIRRLNRQVLARELWGLAARMQFRVNAIEERDGEGAVTGKGIGIGYLLAKDITCVLVDAATFIEGLK